MRGGCQNTDAWTGRESGCRNAPAGKRVDAGRGLVRRHKRGRLAGRGLGARWMNADPLRHLTSLDTVAHPALTD